jgi:hypothetical protein
MESHSNDRRGDLARLENYQIGARTRTIWLAKTPMTEWRRGGDSNPRYEF